MKNFIKKNISSDLVQTAFNQLWKLVSGPLMLVLIPIYLTAEEQGYWFTFLSLAALAILADLGFSTIILQFAAHEFAYLRFDDDNRIIGDELHLKRLSTLFLFCLKWLSSMVLFVFPIILVIGFYMLSSKETNVSWQLPWIIYGVSSALVFLNSSILFFFEGCNLVSKVQNIRFKIAVCTSIIMFLCLVLKFNLYALSLSLCTNALMGTYIIYKHFWQLIKDFIAIAKTYEYSWQKEFLTLLWRYAISWVSGYFIFQIYTPLTFQFHGAVEAGKIGISIALWTAIFSFSSIWISAITPTLNMHVSKQEWIKLDQKFLRSQLLSIVTFVVGSLVFFSISTIFAGKVSIMDRFVSMTSMKFLAACWFLQTIINGLGVYLRAHKEEPMVIPYSISAIYIGLSTLLCAKYLPPYYLFLGYLSSYLFLLPWTFYIFYQRRKRHLEV